MGTINEVGFLLVNTLGSLYLMAILLRFLLQIAQADFYNPITQIVVRFTEPGVKLFRRFIPGIRGVDLSSLVFALIVQMAAMTALVFLSNIQLPGPGLILTWSLVGLLSFILNIYFWGIIISIVASFLAPFSTHPALVLVRQLTEPVMAPFRRLLPPMGGLDLSPIFVFLTLQVIRAILIAPAGVNPRFVLGM
ncbi:MAG: YggT family protein [Pseudohongiellaceae bacterium]